MSTSLAAEPIAPPTALPARRKGDTATLRTTHPERSSSSAAQPPEAGDDDASVLPHLRQKLWYDQNGHVVRLSLII